MVSTYLMKSIYKKIKLSPFFLLIIFISLISGLFKDVITLFMIIIIHELGHIILSYLFKWNIKSVEIGVFGGFITYDDVIDKPFIEEIIISLGGFLMQGLIFLVTYILSKNGLFSIKEASLINRYNLSIFLFNVIPVYPLDGSKILLVILNMFIPYKKSLKITCFISVLLIFLIFLVLISLDVKINSSYIIIGFFIMGKVISLIKDIPYLFNKLLFERYLYKPVNFKITYVNGLNLSVRFKISFSKKFIANVSNSLTPFKLLIATILGNPYCKSFCIDSLNASLV